MQDWSDILAQLPKLSGQSVTAHISRTAAKPIRRGHPWLFDGAITKLSREGEAGEPSGSPSHYDPPVTPPADHDLPSLTHTRCEPLTGDSWGWGGFRRDRHRRLGGWRFDAAAVVVGFTARSPERRLTQYLFSRLAVLVAGHGGGGRDANRVTFRFRKEKGVASAVHRYKYP